MSLEVFRRGHAHVVVVYCKPDGSCQVRDFLRGLQEGDRKKMLALIEASSQNGPPRNREKNHQVEGHRYQEFKTHGHRIFWRWSKSNEIILMLGFVKRDDRTPKGQLDAGDALYGDIEKEL